MHEKSQSKYIIYRFRFCACADECLLKNAEQKFQKKTVITLVFKLKTLVIGNKFDLGRDIQIKFHVVYVIRILV